MKFCLGIVVAVLALNCVLALPAHSPNDDAEVIDVPRRPQRPSIYGDDDTAGAKDFHDFKGVIDTGSGYPFLQSVPHPFSFNLGFFDSFEDIFRRLRTRLWPLDLAAAGGESGEEGGSGFSFNLNPKNGNTTHTVKVVDGHKIEINDTVYGDENSLFKVRVVNIHPLESGENIPDTVSNTNNAGSPVTSAPAATNDNKNNNENDDTESSDERRESLEDDKKPIENEINSNIDDAENAAAIEMLPTTTTTTSIDELDAANLNAEFVTDNTLESGSTEAETNKADDANMENYDDEHDDEETALAAELSDEKMTEDISLQYNEQLTVEDNNNDDENEPETADNFNESNDDDETEELTKAGQAHREDVSSGEDVVEGDGDADDETAKLSAELNEETDKDIDAVSADFDAESISITQENEENEDDDDDRPHVRQSSMKHSSNYAANNKHREDVTSSDDENSDSDETASRPIQMHPQFNAEWETLAEDLAAESNDLSNDIDIYDAVAPVDLSNDLVVNDIAASQPGFPINPDAEFIEVDGTTITKPSLLGPKFEKLSLGVGAGGERLNSTTSYQQHAKQYSQNFK